MSRLRRRVFHDRDIFVAVKLLSRRTKLETPDDERVAASLARLGRRHGFAITTWVFLPDHAFPTRRKRSSGGA